MADEDDAILQALFFSRVAETVFSGHEGSLSVLLNGLLCTYSHTHHVTGIKIGFVVAWEYQECFVLITTFAAWTRVVAKRTPEQIIVHGPIYIRLLPLGFVSSWLRSNRRVCCAYPHYPRGVDTSDR